MRSTISVIICTRDRFDDFCATFVSLTKQDRLPDELVVVDSSEIRKIEEFLRLANVSFEIKYIYSKPGLTLQRNLGIRSSTGNLIYFFDDDVDLDVSYLREVEKIFDEDTQNKTGAVGGKIKNLPEYRGSEFQARFHGLIFKIVRSIFGLGDLGSGRYRLSGMPTFPHIHAKARQCETLTGCCMAFRREVFSQIEFDENLPGYGLMEDVDISKRLIDIGYYIYYEPAAVLVHKASPHNRLDYFRWGEMSVVNYDYLFRKSWSKENYRWLFYYWALLGLVVVNLHNKKALLGTLSGLGKLIKRDIKVKGLR
jgi:GT2 family glycosyltransferase